MLKPKLMPKLCTSSFAVFACLGDVVVEQDFECRHRLGNPEPHTLQTSFQAVVV